MLDTDVFAGMPGMMFFRLLFTPVVYVVTEGPIERRRRKKAQRMHPEPAGEIVEAR